MTESIDARSDYFFEVSYEVANKIGGIYQVISSKAKEMRKYYGDNFYTIGYFDPEKSRKDFKPANPEKLKDIFAELNQEGIKCYYGRWSVEGEPKTILVDPQGFSSELDRIKGEMWDNYGIDSLTAGPEFDEPLLWGYATGKLLYKLFNHFGGSKIAQFHEWLSGPALLKLRQEGIDRGLVFTTHATILGRTMSTSPEVDLLSLIRANSGKTIEEVNSEAPSKYGVKAKHLTEKQSCLNTNVFTTVSDITAREAKFILGKAPDLITYNGLNTDSFPSTEELSYQHMKHKEKLKEFIEAYFRPYYDVDLEHDPRIIFISGRYEFSNKGMDLFIDALAELNQDLKQKKEDINVFTFFFIPSDTRGGKMEVMENLTIYNELQDYIESISSDFKRKLVSLLAQGKNVKQELTDYIDSEFGQQLKAFSHDFRSEGSQNPPLSAFELNYEHDQIEERLKERGLRNREEDKIKVVYYPAYLSVSDKLLSMDYYSAVKGCSAGVFPSKYEPWGYTPHETAMSGDLAVTSDMAGFGKFVDQQAREGEEKGIYVLRRQGKDYHTIVEELKEILWEIVSTSAESMAAKKQQARRISALASWKRLGSQYIKAHNRALK